MAMTAGSSASHHSAGRKNLSSPWTQIVRGELEAPSESDQPVSPMRQQTSDIATIGSPVSPPLALTDDGQHAGEGFIRYNGNADSVSLKVPAWNKPSSGTIVEPIMGDAFAWPPLSEAIRLSPKVQSADPPAATGSKSGFQALVPVNSPRKPAPDTNDVNPVFVQEHMASSRHKLTKHGTNNSNSNASTGFVQNNSTNPAPPVLPSPPPPPSSFPILVGPNGYENFIPPMIDPSLNQPYKGNTWESRPGFMHQPHAMSDNRSSSRRGNFVSRPRSYGTSHRGGHGGRHDHDRGNYRGNRDVNMSSQRTSRSDRGGLRTPPSNVVPFFPPHGVRPFGPRPFPDFYYPGMHMEPFRAGGPFYPSAAPLPVLITLPDDLSSPILNQINYYFSDDNLVKDDYLKKQMDVEGWVHISLIANFPRVKSLTTDEKLILQIMKSSTIVEVKGEKLRRRDDWKKWLVPPSIQVYSESGSHSHSSVGSAQNAIAASLQKMTVEETPLSEPITAPHNYI